jgi:hypothetical protein
MGGFLKNLSFQFLDEGMLQHLGGSDSLGRLPLQALVNKIDSFWRAIG